MATNEPPGRLGSRFPDVLARAVEGDASAFGELWRSTQPGLLRYLFVLCSGPDAEDVASESWLKVIRSLHTFSGDELAFRAWLTTVARNTARDKGRQRARHPERLDGLVQTNPRATGCGAEDRALQAMSTRAALDFVVRTLPPDLAEMVVLRVMVGLDVARVAELVGRSPGAVRVAVHRGIKSLAEALAAPAEANDTVPERSGAVTAAALAAFIVR